MPSRSRPAGLLCASLLAFAVAAFAQSQTAPAKSAAPPENPSAMDATPATVHFDVVSFRKCPADKYGTTKIDMPADSDYLAYHCENISRLIYFAYYGSVHAYSLADGYPSWLDNDRYEFIAKVAPDDIAAWQKLDLIQRRVLMRGILATALRMKVSITAAPVTVYLLAVGKGGAKLTPYKDGDQTRLPDGRVQTGREHDWLGDRSYFQQFTMQQFADILAVQLDHRVLDRTGLNGTYNFSLPHVPMKPESIDPSAHYPTENDPSVMDTLKTIGLRLETSKQPVDRISIDHIERPDEN